MQSITISLKNTAKILVLAVAVLLYFILILPAQAQVGIPASGAVLDGYAWSDNIGWISMNCRTGGTAGQDICATSNYSVVINSAGTITGYAWSSDIGWIRFGGLSGFPATGGTTAVNARVTGTYPDLIFQGWAKACGGDDTNGSCNMAVTVPSSGWDGWIALNGTSPSFRITMTAAGASATSYAWGSTVLGWINFDQVGYVSTLPTLFGANCTILQGASTCNALFTWNILGAAAPTLRNTTTSNTYSSTALGTNAPYSIRQGANTVQARDGSTVLASVVVSGNCVAGTDFANGTSCELTATAPPTITLTTTKRIARVGDTVGVTWTINPSPLATGSCTVTGPGMSGTVTSSGTQTSSQLRNKTRYTITCTGSFPSVTATADVEIIPSASEV